MLKRRNCWKISYFLLRRILSVYMFSRNLLTVGIRSIENHTPNGTCTVHPGGVHFAVHLRYAFIFSLKQQLMDIVTSLCQAKSFKLHSFPTKITQNIPTFTHIFTCQRTTICFCVHASMHAKQFFITQPNIYSILFTLCQYKLYSPLENYTKVFFHTSISLIKKQRGERQQLLFCALITTRTIQWQKKKWP